jgi:hypothetical protein
MSVVEFKSRDSITIDALKKRLAVKEDVTVIERPRPKTPESKFRVAELVTGAKATFEAVEQQLKLRRLGPMPETERQAAIKAMQAEQGKAKITDGLRMIVLGEGADAAILHLKKELAAIDPTYDPGTEF